MNIVNTKSDVFQRTYISALLPGECFCLENSTEVYMMTNYDDFLDEFVVVNLLTGIRDNFTPSVADATWVTRMHVDATAKPYEVEPPKSLSDEETKDLLESLRRVLKPLFDTTTQTNKTQE